MLFKNIIGQNTVHHQLLQMINSERMPHALMLLGKEGSGKLGLALALAQYIQCEARQESEPCGKCASCNKTSKNIHPDIHFTYPTVGSKATSELFLDAWRAMLKRSPYFTINNWLQEIEAGNKQGNITRDECVRIVKKLSLKTFEQGYKVLILWRPEFLGKEGNRLLKMIEEPPEKTIFILVAENQELILNTILSRCQIVNMQPLSAEEVSEGLQEYKNLSAENAYSIAVLAEGNFTQALALAENPENDNAQRFLEWMRLCYAGNGIEMVRWVHRISNIGRENQKHFMQYALHFVREIMIHTATGSKNLRLSGKEAEAARKMSKILPFAKIERIVPLFSDCIFHIERNANPKILFLDTSIQLNSIFQL